MVHAHAYIDNELWSHEKTWVNLKCLLLSQRRQSEKPTHSVIPIIGHSGKGNTIETVRRSLVAKSLEKEGKGWIGKSQGIFLDG